MIARSATAPAPRGSSSYGVRNEADPSCVGIGADDLPKAALETIRAPEDDADSERDACGDYNPRHDRPCYLQETSRSSTSRRASSFSAAFRLIKFILTRGGTAKSTSSIAVPNFMLAWIRFAVTALVTRAVINIPPFVAFAATAFVFARSVSPLERNRSLAL